MSNEGNNTMKTDTSANDQIDPLMEDYDPTPEAWADRSRTLDALERAMDRAREGLVDDALPLCGQLLGELARLLDDSERPSDKTLHMLELVGRIEGCVQDAVRALNLNDER
jgi:hypothetical protein